MTEKTLEYYLVINWKDEQIRALKTRPDRLGAYELVGELTVDITVPDVDIPDLALELEVPQPKLHEAVIRAVDEEDLPDWSDAATTVINRHADILDEAGVTDDLVDVLTTRTLLEATGRPDAREVRAYVEQLLDRVDADADSDVPEDSHNSGDRSGNGSAGDAA